MKKTFTIAAVLLAMGAAAFGQNPWSLQPKVAGVYVAKNYDFGRGQAQGGTVVSGGGTAGTSYSITLATGQIALANGGVFYPFSITAPVTIVDANPETVTPTAVSGCGAGNPTNSCVITATWTYGHGAGATVASGSFGLQEAINDASGKGGTVTIGPDWVAAGGTSAIVAAALPYPDVFIENDGAFPGQAAYYSVQPTSLTVQTAPTPALSSTTAVFAASPVGTWANSAYYLCYTYVDVLGNESACSATSSQTPTLNYSLTVTAPAAQAGAVGWRMYAGASYNLAYLLPVTSAACTVTTVESVIPACALANTTYNQSASTGLWPAAPLTTTSLRPNALGITNVLDNVPESSISFSYQPSGKVPASFRTDYGPFGSAAVSSATASDKTPLGSINFPAGYLNQMFRTIRITGTITGAATATGTFGISAGIAWAGGVTAGAPVAICNPVSASVLGTQTYNVPFSCTLTTNAAGATAVGSIFPTSYFIAGGTAGTTNVVASDSNSAAVGSLGLFSQDQLMIYITPLTEAFTSAQLLDLHIEVIQ